MGHVLWDGLAFVSDLRHRDEIHRSLDFLLNLYDRTRRFPRLFLQKFSGVSQAFIRT
jgi:hypothetical protein